MNDRTVIDSTASVAGSVTIKGTGRLVIGPFAVVDEHVTLDLSSAPESQLLVGARSKIKTGAVLRTYGGRLEIGERTSVGEYNVLASHGGLTIGRHCIFGPYVFINAAAHIIEGADPYRFQGETARGIIIEDDVWLGARVSVLDGVTIGTRCVVGAHALVLSDLPARHVVFGQPAKPQRSIERMKHEDVS